MEYAAFIKLRICKPDLERPYRIPLSTTGCVILLIPPMIMTTVIMLLASFVTYVYAAVTVLVALIIYKWHRREIEEGDYNLVDSQDEEIGEEEAETAAVPPPIL
jgi:MFS superfamily sulfate permease-like transporter